MFMTLGQLLLRRKLYLNIIIIIQLGIALAISNTLIGNYNNTYKAYNLTENYSDSAGFFASFGMGGEMSADIDYELLEKNGTTLEPLPRAAEGRSIQVICYGERTLDGLRDRLTAGRWLSVGDTDGAIECLSVGSLHKIGDTFTEYIGNESYSFVVVGRVDSRAMLISPSRSSQEMTADMLFYEYSTSRSGAAVICCSEKIAKNVGDYGNALVFDMTEESLEHLNTVGKAFSMQQIRDNSEGELEMTVGAFLPFAICFAVMGIFSAFCMSLMNLLDNKKVYDVYFILGMRRADAFLINLGYMCQIAIGVAIVAAVLLALFGIMDILGGGNMLMRFNNLLFSAAYLATVSVVTSAVSMTVLKPTDISR